MANESVALTRTLPFRSVIAKSVQYLAEFVVDRTGPQVEQEKIA
jgi:hypothetical protein